MIEVRNLTKSYVYEGKKHMVLNNISFRINKGESTAILGKNGAGKSTLLRLLGGIDFPDSGEIKKDCTISWPVGLTGGFQGSLTGFENVKFVCKIFNFNKKKEIEEKIFKVEEFAELGNAFYKMPFKNYSSGMRSRVSFGLSMAFDFDVYLIDEVKNAGDQRFRDKSKKILIGKKKYSDFLMVDHNLQSLKFCDKAIVLHNGSVIEFTKVEEAISAHLKLMKNKR